MKKLFAVLSLFLVVSLGFAAPTERPTPKKDLTEEQKAELAAIETRIAEIQAMDFSDMSKAEKKEIREELRDMKAQAKKASGGIYISTGAIIIILLLIIIL
jgi:hypothetical protein